MGGEQLYILVRKRMPERMNDPGVIHCQRWAKAAVNCAGVHFLLTFFEGAGVNDWLAGGCVGECGLAAGGRAV